MECRPLKVKVISARDLRDVRLIFDMNPYVVASLVRGERHSSEQRTPAHRDGGTSPCWNHAPLDPFTVHVAAARADLLTLKLEIKTERTLGDRDIGWVGVPVKDLLEQGGDGSTKEMSCPVSTGGVLEFSYKFGESFTLHGAAADQLSGNQQQPGPGVGLSDVLRIGETIVDVVDTVVGVLNA